jgi:site-specific recombinase XerD
MSVLNHLTQFRLALQARKLRPRTIDSYAKDVKRFERWFQQERGEPPIRIKLIIEISAGCSTLI